MIQNFKVNKISTGRNRNRPSIEVEGEAVKLCIYESVSVEINLADLCVSILVCQ